MTHYSNILVAFDGSSNSVQALEVAKTLAKDYQSRLTVAYVHEGPLAKPTATGDPHMVQSEAYVMPGPMVINQSPPQVNDEQIMVEDDKPDEVITKAKGMISNELEVQYEVLFGKPAVELNQYVKNNDIDLIVIGNRGLSGIKKIVMGSVSQKVANHAACAVFIVK